MKIKNVIYALLAVTLLWSCGKDDGPSTPVKTPTISSFSPTSGPVGTQVTIKGTNFATKKADNTVKFGTVKATVDDATATQLKVTVPVGATTSKITVTVDGETSTSASGFTVTEEKSTSPEFEVEGYGFQVAENIDDTAVIGTVKATDTDGDKLTYDISNNENGLFKIGEDSGEITLADGKNLDFETTDGHTITVTVTDGTNTVEIEVTIKVTNVIESLFDDPASFITTWTTLSDNFKLQIGISDKLAYDFTINWGDGTEEELTIQGGFFTHIYETAGTYTVAIQGKFPAIRMKHANGDSQDALISIDQWGSIAWEDMENAFNVCRNMEYHAMDAPDLTSVTNMSYMFAVATSFNGDLNNWNVSGVKNMSGMFIGATSFNGDISGWETGEVTDMSLMFEGATAFNRDLNGWNVEKVMNMLGMFIEAMSFNGDISGWVPKEVTDMSYMFAGANSFNGDISSWNVEKVMTMDGMFEGANSFDQNLGSWNIRSITTMNRMLNNSGMSKDNYEKTLEGWANNVNTPESITLGAEGIHYCDGAAKTVLLNKGWTITDEGQGQNCP